MQLRSDTVPPTSFNSRVDMALAACVLRACVLCAIVLRLAGSHHDHCTYAKSFFVGELYGIDWPFFLEDDRLTERVSRSLLGTAEPEGSPAKLTRFFRLWERAAPATGRGRGRDSRPAGPRSDSCRASRSTARLAVRGRRENGPPVEKNTILLWYIIIVLAI